MRSTGLPGQVRKLPLRSEAIMTAYLISLALVGLIAIALSEAFA
jgi:hypothetical protein